MTFSAVFPPTSNSVRLSKTAAALMSRPYAEELIDSILKTRLSVTTTFKSSDVRPVPFTRIPEAVPFSLLFLMLLTLFFETTGLKAIIEIPASLIPEMLFLKISILLIIYISIPDEFEIVGLADMPIFPPDMLLSVILQSLALTEIPVPFISETTMLNPEMDVLFAVDRIVKPARFELRFAFWPMIESSLGTTKSSE